MNNIKTPNLKIVSGQYRDTVFVLEKEKYSCGRDVSNDIVIDDDSIDAKHCEFLREGSAYTIHNVGGETKDTKVNHVQKNECKLRNYDAIQIGVVELLYSDGELGEESKNPSLRTGIDLEQIEPDTLPTQRMKNISPFAENGRSRDKLAQLATTVIVIFLAVATLSLIMWLFLTSYL